MAPFGTSCRLTPCVLLAIGVGCGNGDDGTNGSEDGPLGTGGNPTNGPDDEPLCPDVQPPTLVTELAGARSPEPDGHVGTGVPQLNLNAPDPNFTYNDPHVLRVGSEYWMYASATEGFDYPVEIYRLVSSDGASWSRDPVEPVFEAGLAGTWDAGGVETPAVLFFRGQYHLFYTGYPFEVDSPDFDVTTMRVGHATSCDGVQWERTSEEPVLAPSGTDVDPANDWSAFVVAEPGPVSYQDQIYLYFTALGVDAALGTSLQVIGLTTSSDGQSWSEPEIALTPDQDQYPRVIDRGPPLDGWVGYSTPNALVLNDEVHLFVDVAYDPDETQWRQIRLHHAVSPNGKTAWQQDAASLLAAGDYPWAVQEVRAPGALIDGSVLRLYFAGHELDGMPPEHFAIGLLTQDLVPDPTEP